MKTSYKVSGYHGTAQSDNWENGCDGPYKSEWLGRNDWSLEANSLSALIKMLCEEFNCTEDCISLNSCDEMGRLDIQVQQREPFERAKPSAKTLERFKKGDINMWLTDYVMHVEIIISEMDLQLTLNTEKEMTK